MTLREFKKDRILFYSFIPAGSIILISLLVSYLNLFKINNLLILHFDSYTGIDFLGNKVDVYNVLAIAGLIVLLNSWLAIKVYFKERFLSYTLGVISLIFSVLILITIFVIISIN